MKKFKLFIVSVIAIVCLVVSGGVFTSCSNDDDLLLAGDSQTEQVSSLAQDSVRGITRGTASNGAFSWTYFPNSSQNYSTSSVGDNKPGYGGIYIGGLLNATLIENSGNFYVRLTFNGGSINYSGTAVVKIGSLYSGYGNNCTTFSSGATHVDIPVSITLDGSDTSNLGVMNLWPVIVTNIGGTTARFYTYPIMIWTNPLCNTSTTQGDLQGYVDNVPVYEVSGGCVQFCRSYYSSVYNMDLSSMGSGAQWYINASNNGLSYYANGTTAPQVGDVICWTGGMAPYKKAGHVAIIIEVQPGYVKIAQQGRASMDPIGYQISRTNSTTLANGLNSSYYTLKGLIRKDN